LYIDINVSRKGFRAHVYYCKGDKELEAILRSDIEPILFLSKGLSIVESHY